MMRNFPVVVFALLIIVVKEVAAQDSTRSRSIISVGIGASVPLGQFKAASSSADGHGFAVTGFHYQLEYAGFWSRHTGFGVQVGGFGNGVNETAYKNDFYAIHTPTTPGMKLTLSSVEPWKTYYVMTGPYVSLPMQNVIIDFKALGGVLITRTPNLSYSLTNTTSTLASGSTGVNTEAFGYSLGTNIRLMTDKNTQIRFGIEYLQGFVDTAYNNSSSSAALIYPFSGGGEQSIAVLNLSWGITFFLGRP